ncbi:MAG: hypothetical protein ACRYGA_16870 [Janthinobacterium lividum]
MRARLLSAMVIAAAMLPGIAAHAADCPQEAVELPVQALYGRWEARFDGGTPAGVQLAKHPEYEGGVRGTIVRDGITAQLSGDVDDAGQLMLDESQDGQRISAVWSGDLTKESCGKEFQGTWRNSKDDSVQGFVLHKIAP